MKKLYIYIPLLMLCFLTENYCQITGVVVAHESEEPIVGAVIRCGSNNTVTDFDGRFQIQGEIGDSIEIIHISYQKYVAPINDSFLEIRMFSKSEILQQLSVVSLSEAEYEEKRIKSSVSPVTVINANELISKASDLNEILARQAGIQLRKTGGLGSQARINIRGLEGKRVQIFIDGNPLNTPDGSLGINDLPLQVIERIEIYKGSVPAWLGGDGLGSAVNIVIRHREVSYIDVNIVRQSYNTNNFGLILKKSFDSQGIGIGIGAFHTSADNNYEMKVPFQENLKVIRDHDKYSSLLIGGGISFDKLWFDEIEVEFAYMNTHKEIQGITRNIQHAENRGITKVGVLNLQKSGLLNDRGSLKYSLIVGEIEVNFADTSSYSYSWNADRTASIFGRGELGNGPNLSKTLQDEIRHRLNLNLKSTKNSSLNLNNTMRIGKFNPMDDIANEFAGKNLFDYPANLFNTVSGLTYEHSLLRNQFLYSSAIKHYYNSIEGFNTNVYTTTDPEQVNRSTHYWGYYVGLRYNINSDLLIKAVHERAVRLPNNSEIFGDGVLITPSLTLKPEIAYNYSIGLVFDQLKSQLNRIQIDFNTFFMSISDLIQLAGNGLSVGYVNYAKARIYGADFEIKSDLTSWLYSSFNITYQKVVDNNKYIPGTENVENPTYKLDIPNIPQLFANLNIELHRKNLIFSNSKTRVLYDLSYSREYNYGFALGKYDQFVIPYFLTHTLSLEHAFQRDRYAITFEVNNITDQEVINNFNQPLPGRTFRLKLRCLLLGKELQNHNH